MKHTRGYNKANPRFYDYYPQVPYATGRARELDKQPEDRWPNYLGTRVYLLVEKIVSLSTWSCCQD